ncbi:hypothetical protein ACHWQZ_G002553 [Mnemiopsis leidyi]
MYERRIFQSKPIGLTTIFLISLGAISAKKLTIARSESFNYHGDYAPDRAYDGDYYTFYSVKDGEVAGNFLKLYLSHTYSIGEVILVNRKYVNGYYSQERLINTEVRVYSTEGGEKEVASCGTITELNSGETNTLDGRTYSLYCNGAVGDMLYITDLIMGIESKGHNIAEAEIYGRESLSIESSQAKSTDDPTRQHTPEKAYDGDYTTWYSVEDGNTEGNFLKLYLAEKSWIGTVKITNRDAVKERIVGTVVMVYSTVGSERKVANCGGEVTENDMGVAQQTISLDCNGAAGDMVHITDRKFDVDQAGVSTGHSILEVRVYGTESLPIKRSESKSWQDDENRGYAPEKAYDEDEGTAYLAKDGDAVGNYLKLYLSKEFQIGIVELTNRGDNCCRHRMAGTVVMAYSTRDGSETKAADCGQKITDLSDHVFSLNCNGATGDMIYINDTETDGYGHGIAEVRVFDATSCTTLSSSRPNVWTEPPLPVQHGTTLTFKCPGGHVRFGGDTASCLDGNIVQTNGSPACQLGSLVPTEMPVSQFQESAMRVLLEIRCMTLAPSLS